MQLDVLTAMNPRDGFFTGESKQDRDSLEKSAFVLYHHDGPPRMGGACRLKFEISRICADESAATCMIRG